MGSISSLKKYGSWGLLLVLAIGGLFAISADTFKGLAKRTAGTEQGPIRALPQCPHKASSYLKSYPPTNLSDSSPETFWHVSLSVLRGPAWATEPSWVWADFGTDSGGVINSFQALPRKHNLSNFWRKAVLQGSNNGFFWTELADTSVEQVPASAEWLTWYFDAKRRYRYYRLFIESGFYSGGRFVAFAEWKFNHCDLSTDTGIASRVQTPKDSPINVLLASSGSITLKGGAVFLCAVFVLFLTMLARTGWPHAINEAIERVVSNPQRLWWLLFYSFIVQFPILYGGLLLSEQIFTHDAIIWFGSFYYYVDALTRGCMPLWDPYMLAGTPFYPNIHIHGLLDPLIALPLLMVKVLGTSHLASFIYFYLARLLVLTLGAYYLFKHITGCRLSSMVSAGILLFALTPASLRQVGILWNIYLTPFALYSILLFFENIQNSRRYLYLSCFVITTGISLNYHIPASFIFNLLMFLVVAMALRIIRLGELIIALRDRKFLAFLFLSLFVILMMVAPPVAVYKDCHGTEGELFPTIRIIQKCGTFKKLLASEIDESIISNTFTKHLGVYSSYGDILGLVRPGTWEQFFMGGKLSHRNVISEAHMYIGIISVVLCIIGLIYSKSRYKYLASIMLLLVFLNMFSYYGVNASPPNTIQKGFNLVVPLLETMEVREVLSGFFLLYLCMLLSLGLKLFFNVEEFASLLKEKYVQIISVCISIVLINIIVSGYYLGDKQYTSRINLVWTLILLGIALFVYTHSRELVTKKIFNLFYASLLLIMFADIFYYNYSIREYVLRTNWLDTMLSENEERVSAEKNFEYFRVPFVNNTGVEDEHYEPLGFSESMFKVKGAMSRGNNHHFFTTKIYYDYMTHVPLQNQFILSGIVYPITRFFPADRVKTMSKMELLDYFEVAEEDALSQYLFLLKNGQKEATERTNKNSSLDLNQLPDVSCHDTAVSHLYSKYLENNGERLRQIRRDIGEYLQTPSYQLVVTHFSPNELNVLVKTQEDGYLYYNDGWSKYWKAFDGDKEVPIKIANYNFKAVYLEKGEHLVRFVFNPWHYRYSVYAYYMGLFSCLCVIVFVRSKWWDIRSHQ